MNDLKLISQTTPAVVSFNYAEINKHLDDVLVKYGGLLFTEDTVAECKKTISELKKGQKSLSDFRIKTKKLLTEDITKFEDQCKKLSDKFDTVINPISKQADAFEVKRKEDKKAEIQTIIDTLTDERFLEYKYYSQLIITEQMLNKGTKIKAITVGLTNQADLLLSQQNIEEANIELIKGKVELANAQYGVTLPTSLYLRLLEDKEVSAVIKLITDDAEKTKVAAEEAEAEKLAIEERKVERAAKLEDEKIANEAKKVERERLAKIANDVHENQLERIKESQAIHIQQKSKVVSSPPSLEPQVAKVAEVTDTETYRVTGTEAQLDALEAYLNVNGYDWI